MIEKNFYNKRPAYSKTLGGYTINRPLEKPIMRYRGGFIFLSVDPESCLIGGDRFVPTFDDTDHLQFACANCFSIADILAVVKRGDEIYFWLGCPKCGKTGQRKIYLTKRTRRAFCHNAYFPEKGVATLYDDKDLIVGKWRIHTPPFNTFTRISSPETALNDQKKPCNPLKNAQTTTLRDSDQGFKNTPLGSPQTGESKEEVEA